MIRYNTENRAIRLLSLIVLLLGVVVLPVHADLSGRYGGEFMSSGGGARMLGLGGASVSLVDDAWALFWNPAGLQQVQHRQVAMMHSERFEGVVDYDAASVAIPQPDGSVWSAGMIRLGVNGIPFTKLQYPDLPPDAEGNRVLVDKVVNEAEYALFAAMSDKFGRWNWGVAPKLIFKHFGTESQAYGLGVDAGVSGRPLEWIPIDAGLVVRDLLGTVLLWDTGRKEILAPTLRFGLSSIVKLPSLEATLVPVADIAYNFQNFGDSDAATLHFGLEYLVREIVALRVGQDDGELTFGGGLQFKPITINYAFISHDELGDTHRVSFGVRWG